MSMFHLHKWSKWEPTDYTRHWWGQPYEPLGQYRRCEVCGKTQIVAL